MYIPAKKTPLVTEFPLIQQHRVVTKEKETPSFAQKKKKKRVQLFGEITLRAIHPTSLFSQV